MTKYHIGVDIGATKIAAALVGGGKVIKETKTHTEAKKLNSTIIKNIKAAIKEVYSPSVKGIGVGIAGYVNADKGTLVSSPNFSKKFKNINLGKILKQEFKKPVRVENDANCFTLGEAYFGAGRGHRHVIGLTLGTGIGGGIVINKKIYNGSSGLAGELGYLVIYGQGIIKNYSPPPYLEHYASGPAMEKIYRALGGPAIDSYAIQSKYEEKDRRAVKTFKIMAYALGLGLASLMHAFNPNIIVLGGGLAEIKFLTEPAIRLSKKLVVYPELAQTKIVATKLKGKSPILGAVALFKK